MSSWSNLIKQSLQFACPKCLAPPRLFCRYMSTGKAKYHPHRERLDLERKRRNELGRANRQLQ